MCSHWNKLYYIQKFIFNFYFYDNFHFLFLFYFYIFIFFKSEFQLQLDPSPSSISEQPGCSRTAMIIKMLNSDVWCLPPGLKLLFISISFTGLSGTSKFPSSSQFSSAAEKCGRKHIPLLYVIIHPQNFLAPLISHPLQCCCWWYADSVAGAVSGNNNSYSQWIVMKNFIYFSREMKIVWRGKVILADWNLQDLFPKRQYSDVVSVSGKVFVEFPPFNYWKCQQLHIPRCWVIDAEGDVEVKNAFMMEGIREVHIKARMEQNRGKILYKFPFQTINHLKF